MLSGDTITNHLRRAGPGDAWAFWSAGTPDDTKPTMNLLKHLAAQFPGLPLEPPLFYNWPIALRFELNIKRDNPPDFDAVADRAAAIYESAFAAKDVAYIISVTRHFTGEGHRRRRFGYQGHEDKRLFSLARRYNLGISRPSGVGKFVHTRKEIEEWGASRTRIEWAEVSPQRIDYRFLFRMIAHEDFPMGAGIDGEVFFFNHTRSILLHMYDDRGLDAIAATRDALQPVYATHHGWLLDYDRTRIDQTFGGP